MQFKEAEKYRKPHPGGLPHKEGDTYGWFEIPINPCGTVISIMVSSADPEAGVMWDHVSVSLPSRCPTWEEMCRVKELFWGQEECVVQYHPPKSDYVSNHRFCLHLWRWVGGEMPRPPSIFVGTKDPELLAKLQQRMIENGRQRN